MQYQVIKPFIIDKHLIMNAWKWVRENKGSAGIDNVSTEEYESNLGKNLYKLWNRMSSGSYFPGAVKLVDIHKHSGGTHPLGIPTVGDCIAQMLLVLLNEESSLRNSMSEDFYIRFCENEMSGGSITLCK